MGEGRGRVGGGSGGGGEDGVGGRGEVGAGGRADCRCHDGGEKWQF